MVSDGYLKRPMGFVVSDLASEDLTCVWDFAKYLLERKVFRMGTIEESQIHVMSRYFYGEWWGSYAV